MELEFDDLEKVTGGAGGKNCWFEPQVPMIITGEGDRRRVKCKSRCSGGCGCHGTNMCIDSMHLIENAPPEAREFWPYPVMMNNHNDARKRILVP
jgi:hypothetical protein